MYLRRVERAVPVVLDGAAPTPDDLSDPLEGCEGVDALTWARKVDVSVGVGDLVKLIQLIQRI